MYQHYDLYRWLRLQFLLLQMMGAVTPETCRVIVQYINICILLHLVGFLLKLNFINVNEISSTKIKTLYIVQFEL